MNTEKLLLACVLIDAGCHDQLIPELKPEYFNTDREIAAKICEMYRKHKQIDTYTVCIELPEHRSEILKLSNILASSANYPTYLGQVKDNYLRSQIHKFFGVQIGQSEDPYDYLAEKMSQLGQLQESVTPHIHRELTDIITDALEELYKSKTETFGIPTPLTELNNVTNGWQPSDLIILAGRPSRGKTAFALANVRTCCEAGKRAAIFSLEMGDVQLMKRLIYSMGVGYDEAAGIISRWNLEIFEKGGIDISYIVSNCRLLKHDKGLDFAVIDYLGLMRLPKAENRAYAIGEATRSLKALAKELKIPIMLLAQLNRDIEKRGNHLHQLSDLRESGDIEQDADQVIFVSRPIMDGATEDKEGNKTDYLTLIQIEKNRNGKAPVTIKARNNERVNHYEDWNTPEAYQYDHSGDQPGYQPF